MSSNSDSNSLSPSAKLLAKQMEDARKKMYKERVEEIKRKKAEQRKKYKKKKKQKIILLNSSSLIPIWVA